MLSKEKATWTEDHVQALDVGIHLHNKREYAAALDYLLAAQNLARNCPAVMFNLANTLHMLGRDKEAYDLLRELTAEDKPRPACPDASTRSFVLDGNFLLFRVTMHLKGFCEEAFGYAEEHLRQRTRGLKSTWTLRDVRAEIKAMRKEWEED